MNTKEKDLERFLQIHREMEEGVFKSVMRHSNNNYHIAQEITQEVFIKVYQYFDTYEEPYLRRWAMITARNLTINYMKKMAKEVPCEEIVLTSDLHGKIPSVEETFFEEAELRERENKCKTILELLYEKNERWYDAVTLTYIVGMKQKDVAEKLGVSLEVLEAVLYRARKRIRENFKWEEETE